MLSETLAAYTANRATSAPLPTGSAPYTSAEAFKLRRHGARAKQWDHRLSSESSNRATSTLKASSRVQNPEATIPLGTARPSPQYYPWQSLTIRSLSTKENAASTTAVSCEKGESAYDLGLALNYGYAAGSPQLLRFVTEHVEMMHKPPYQDWDCSLTCGTTSAMEIVLRMLCNPGDSVLVEAYTYPGTVEAAKGLALDMIGIKMDENGLLPDHLDTILTSWNDKLRPKPSVLYTVPTGHNPTGINQPIERRKAVYEVAERHDLLIIEDDPYYFIQLGEASRTDQSSTSLPRSNDEYLERLPASYLSLDRSGRVLRIDATSKILAPGLRCGWITGCSQLIQKFIHHTELSAVAPSGPSQVLLYKLLDETWGHQGFVSWLNDLSLQYRERLNTMVSACERYLPESLCKWVVPSFGMFLWVKVDWVQHPAALRKCSGTAAGSMALDVETRVFVAAKERGVIVSKGSWFATDQTSADQVHFRLAFVTAAETELEEAIRRFAGAIDEEFALQSLDWSAPRSP